MPAGNPFVTPDTTRDVVITARLSAVNVFFDAIEKLMFELSIWRCTPEMQARQPTPTHSLRCMACYVHLISYLTLGTCLRRFTSYDCGTKDMYL